MPRIRDAALLLVVDFRSIIRTYRAMPDMYVVYNEYSIQDILQDILSIRSDCDFDTTERLWLEFEARFPNGAFNSQELEKIDLIFDMMMQDVDEYIRHAAPEHYSDHYFVFEKWVNNVSILLSATDD